LSNTKKGRQEHQKDFEQAVLVSNKQTKR